MLKYDKISLKNQECDISVCYGADLGILVCNVFDNKKYGELAVTAVGEYAKFLYAIARRYKDGDKDYHLDMLYAFRKVFHFCYTLRTEPGVTSSSYTVADYVSYFIVNYHNEPFYDTVIVQAIDYLPGVDDGTKKMLKRLSMFMDFWTWHFHCHVLHHAPINDKDKHGYFLFIDRYTSGNPTRHFLSSSFDIVSWRHSVHLQEPKVNNEFFYHFDCLNNMTLEEIEKRAQASSFPYLEDAVNFIHTAYYGLWDDMSNDPAIKNNPAYPLHYFMLCCRNLINMGVHDNEIGVYRDMVERYYRHNMDLYRQRDYTSDHIPVLDIAFINKL